MITYAILAACGLAFVGDLITSPGNIAFGGGGGLNDELLLWAPFVDNGEWYRVISSAFAHAGLLHIGFNGYLLWAIGRGLESRFGALTFATMYLAGILGGALGALLIEPQAAVVGASGAVFALMGVIVILQGRNGLSVLADGIGPLVVLNVLLSFRGGISLGGHFGGLAAGLIMGAFIVFAQSKSRRHETLLPIAFGALALALFVAMIPAVERAVSSF